MAIANITGNILTDTGVAISSLVSGSGTTNFLPKFTGSTTIGNSLIFDNGTNVGIGNTNTSFTFDVTGTGRFTGIATATIFDSTSNAFRLNGNNALSLVTLNSQSVVKINAAGFWGTQLVGANDKGILIDNNGNIGIGTNNPAEKLTINAGSTSAFTMSVAAQSTFAFGGLNGKRVVVINDPTAADNGLQFGYDTTDKTGVIAGAATSAGCGIDFYTYNGSSWGNRMRLTNTGNFGIGSGSFSEGTQPSGTLSFIPNSSVSSGPLIQMAGNGRIRPASTGDRLSIEGNSLFLNPTFYTDVVIGGTGNYGSQTLSIRNAWSGGSYGQIVFYTGTGNSSIRSNIPGNSTNGLQFLTYWSNNGDKVAATFDGFGNVYNYNNTTAWQQTSDIRVKENINNLTNALEIISQLNPVTFDYKKEFATDKNWDDNKKLNNIGFIAQDFEQVFPKYVHSSEQKIGEITIEDFKTIDTGHLVPYLIKAIQELSAKVSALENK